jgi:hypothetical protein
MGAEFGVEHAPGLQLLLPLRSLDKAGAQGYPAVQKTVSADKGIPVKKVPQSDSMIFLLPGGSAIQSTVQIFRHFSLRIR